MPNNKEIEIMDRSVIPEFVYHVVPQLYFETFIDSSGCYDCRGREEWGKNSPFIHTTTNLADLQNRVSGNWNGMPKDWVFYLLKIDTAKLPAETKFSYADYNGVRYIHIWDKIPVSAYTFSEIRRSDEDGAFILT